MRSYEKWQNISQQMCLLADFLKFFFSVSRAMIKTLTQCYEKNKQNTFQSEPTF